MDIRAILFQVWKVKHDDLFIDIEYRFHGRFQGSYQLMAAVCAVEKLITCGLNSNKIRSHSICECINTHTHILFDEISIWFGNQYAHISTIWTRSLTQFIWLFISIGTLFSTPHHTHPMAIHRTAMACRILNPSNQTDLLWNTGVDP